MTARSKHHRKRLVQRKKTASFWTNQMITTLIRITHWSIPHRLLTMRSRRRLLRVRRHANPEGEVQGRALEVSFRGRTVMRKMPHLHSLVKLAGKQVEQMATKCKSRQTAHRTKAGKLRQRTRQDPTPKAVNSRWRMRNHCQACSRFDPSSRVYGDTLWPPKSYPSSSSSKSPSQ